MRVSVRQALVLSLIPAWFGAGSMVAGTAVALELTTGRVESLQAALDAGTLDRAALWQAGRDARLAGIGATAAMLAFTAASTVGLALAGGHLARRSRRLAAWIERTEAGVREPAPEPAGDDAVAGLERVTGRIVARMADRAAALQDEARRSRFDGKLQRALDLVDTEDEALSLAEAAMTEIVGDRPFEVLLAEGDDAHLRPCAGSAERPGCPVSAPSQCAAVRRGQTLVFASSAEIDACPKLRSRPGRSACCTPVTVMGRTIGVIHATGPDRVTPDEEQVRRLESFATHVGGRISALRTLASSESRAQTDGMTGLWNRRTFEAAVAARMQSHPGATDAVVLADLDQFKRLNDTAGHDAGDRALRLFASVLRGAVRETDLVARYGGEEFALLLLDCDETRARAVMAHVRKRLAQAVGRAAGPPFTASYGVSVRSPGAALADLVAQADAAMYHAKRSGRDRVCTQTDLERAGATTILTASMAETPSGSLSGEGERPRPVVAASS